MPQAFFFQMRFRSTNQSVHSFSLFEASAYAAGVFPRHNAFINQTNMFEQMRPARTPQALFVVEEMFFW